MESVHTMIRPHSVLYEVNALTFVSRLSKKYGRRLTLDGIPEEEWRLLDDCGIDLVWLMGVWQRSASSRQIALTHPGLQREYGAVLPGWSASDVEGSPYAVYAYRVDETLGAPKALEAVRSRLNALGLRLIVDFVPNHLAVDHPWTTAHPDRFVQGAPAEAADHPEWYFSRGGNLYLAHGRDPNSPPWTDTVQVNLFSKELRKALIGELLRISKAADGVRCDMSMLALNDVFKQTWGTANVGPPLHDEFWSEAIEKVKRRRSDFLFIAEAYWGLERRLQELGFDATYDKTFYDLLCGSDPLEIRRYISSHVIDPQRTVRFIENHDEARAAAKLGRDRSMAAAVVLATVPGMRMFHDGQFEGRRLRLPLQLKREPEEAVDEELSSFYRRLLAACHSPAYHEGQWKLLETTPAPRDDKSLDNLLVWSWEYQGDLRVVAVNYSAEHSQAIVRLALAEEIRGDVGFRDDLSAFRYSSGAETLRREGLPIGLGPWQAQLLCMETA